MTPEIHRASVLLGPIVGALLGIIFLAMFFGLPLVVSDLPNGFGIGGVVAFSVTWVMVTAIMTLIGMRVVLRVDDRGVTSGGRTLAWADIATVERENRIVTTQGYNSATGITTRRTQHDLVIFRPKASGVPPIEINAALMKMGADGLAARMREFHETYGDAAVGQDT